jgi:phosphoribosyl-dephospho-CoA transferase
MSYSVVKICFSIDSRSWERAPVRSCQTSPGNEQLILIRYTGLDLKMITVEVQSKTTAELLDIGILRVTSRFKSRRIIYVL